ncbi:Serine-threonine/tyrosine-protein kinase, catalytic domain [Dillenia turbinata]|uniref:Serine-threonine/tyrosine-protein kinase, catalytic domain n=1 Tax=Dillenia turbinata TaxID=194707 RepID=A0AAN8VBZ0_9MAGN
MVISKRDQFLEDHVLLVILGSLIGGVIGIFVSSVVFICIKSYRELSNTQIPTPPKNSLTASIDSSPRLSTSRSAYELQDCVSPCFWQNHHNKDVIPISDILNISYRDIKKATKNFTTILEKHSFGPVFQATMPTGEELAVKMLASNSKQGVKAFQTEAVLLSRLHHRNLVNLKGYCVNKEHFMLIYEYLGSGSLAKLLYGEGSTTLSWEQRFQIAVDVSCGIEYLHEGAVPPVVHCDLKSANILLDHSLRAKVSDFGLAMEDIFNNKRLSSEEENGCIDPEVESRNKFTKESDIYSFGIIIFELITAIHPEQNLLEYIDLASASPEGVDEILDRQLVGNCNMEEVRDLAKIGLWCLDKLLRNRPSIEEVSQAIANIRKHQIAEESKISFEDGDELQVAAKETEVSRVSARTNEGILFDIV